MSDTQEKIIIDEINPVLIYGAGNKILDKIISHFPKLKIIARGSDITVTGAPGDRRRFRNVIDTMTVICKAKGGVEMRDVDRIFDEDDNVVSAEDIVASTSTVDSRYVIVYGNEGRIVRAKTKNQKKLVDEYESNDLIFALGPAGTGKTYTAIALAVRALKNKEVKKLILTRPAVEAGERLGFLPGDLKDKLDPYLQPLYDALHDMIHPRKLEMLMEEGIIQIAPLAYMRGRTLDSAFVILDEAQNTSIGQLKMFLTRMGCHAKFIVTGDASQIDFPKKSDSGLLHGVELVKNIKGVSVIHFENEDIVRHPLVTKIVKAFENDEKKNTGVED